jgi:hypothetical protein
MGILNFDYITCDKRGNIFVTAEIREGSQSVYSVLEYPKGDQYGAHDIGITLSYAGGIKPDKAGNLLIVDPLNFVINEYTEAGVPTGVSISTGTGQINDIAVSKSNAIVGGTDGTIYQREGVSWTYPGGTPSTTYTPPGQDVEPYGFAFDPPFDPGLKKH